MVYDDPGFCSNIHVNETGFESGRQNSRWLEETRDFFQTRYPTLTYPVCHLLTVSLQVKLNAFVKKFQFSFQLL